MTSPLVSVVLSVRNGAADLPAAVDTILSQTFTDFELIAVNNGSTDGTAAVLDGLRDRRVRVVHQDDMGLAAALNRGIELARGAYIARQDHDDWAKPARLANQVAFMEANPDCALVGTRAEIWIKNQPTGRAHDHPCDNAALQFELLFDNPFVHSSVMIRRAALDVVGGYCIDPARQPPEDYELWSRLARRYQVANLPERLTVYREVSGSMSRASANPFRERLISISAENLARAVGEPEPDRAHFDIAALLHHDYVRMSRHPDIERMSRIVLQAADRIQANAPDVDIFQRAKVRVRKMRLEHFLFRTGLYCLRPIGRLALGWRPSRLSDSKA